jgi:hypothetical protein
VRVEGEEAPMRPERAWFIDLMISSVVKINKENMEEGTVGEFEERRKDRLKDKLSLL